MKAGDAENMDHTAQLEIQAGVFVQQGSVAQNHG